MIVAGSVEAVVASYWRNEPRLFLCAVAARNVISRNFKLSDKLLYTDFRVIEGLITDICVIPVLNVLPTDAVSTDDWLTNLGDTFCPGLHFTVDRVCVPLTDNAFDSIDGDLDVTLCEAMAM
jgi:hypothetical protein